jgi:hypothetical protein
VGLVLAALLGVQGAGEMFGMAAEGGGAESELRGQGAVGDPGHEAAVDLRAGRVRADGTAFYHKCAPKQKFPHDAGLEHRLSREAMGGPAQAGRLAEITVKFYIFLIFSLAYFIICSSLDC